MSSLFDKSFDLIFLADRWFNSTSLMKHIDSLGHTYCIRLKSTLKTLIYDARERHRIWKTTGDIKAQKEHSKLFYNLELTRNKYKCNLAISKSDNVKEPWIIITNGDPKRAIKDYGYRFGAIESIF